MYFLLIIYFIAPYAQCRHEGIAEDFLTEVAGREWLHGKDGGADVVGSVAQRAFHAVVVILGIGYYHQPLDTFLRAYMHERVAEEMFLVCHFFYGQCAEREFTEMILEGFSVEVVDEA